MAYLQCKVPIMIMLIPFFLDYQACKPTVGLTWPIVLLKTIHGQQSEIKPIKQHRFCNLLLLASILSSCKLFTFVEVIPIAYNLSSCKGMENTYEGRKEDGLADLVLHQEKMIKERHCWRRKNERQHWLNVIERGDKSSKLHWPCLVGALCLIVYLRYSIVPTVLFTR